MFELIVGLSRDIQRDMSVSEREIYSQYHDDPSGAILDVLTDNSKW
jgi:hypothetical protein